MDLAMVNGFDEMSFEEMREVDGGFAIIPAVIAVGKTAIAVGKATVSVAKAAYATPIGKKVIDGAATTLGALIVNEIFN